MMSTLYISCEDLQNLLLDEGGKGQVVLLDIRDEAEFEIAHLEGSLLLAQLAEQVELADFVVAMEKLRRQVVTICHHGARSHAAASFLKEQGLSRVRCLAGGIDAWARSIDPHMPRY